MNILFLISLAHGVVITVLLRRYYHIFFNECKVSNGVEWLCYALSLLASTITSLSINGYIVWNFIFNFLGKYLLTFIYRGSNKARLLLPLIFMVVIAAFEIMLILLMLPASASLVEYSDDPIFHTVGPLYSVIFMYVFVFIVEGVNSSRTGIRFSPKYWISFAITPILTFLIIVLVMSIPGVANWQVGVCTLFLLALNLVSFYFYEIMVSYITNKMEKDVAEEKNLYYAKQLETLTDMMESLRSYQHDLKNHAIVADAYFQNGEFEKVRKYYYEVIRRPLLQNVDYFTGNRNVDSFLNYKSIEAKSKGVVLDMDVKVPPSFRIRSSSLVVVIGNLLDNAIEAASTAENKEVNVKIAYAHHCIMVKIKNQYCGSIKKSGSRFLSNKENSLLHGYGLRNVKRIVDENGGTLNISDENNQFTVNVLLYDKE